jgi:WhiB family transcriptional regulator, redox-sensing transcriptional regulator
MKLELKEIQVSGRCSRDGNHHLFFSEKPSELAEAQRICSGCSVRVTCLEIALENRHEWGVWGGVIFWDGQPYHRRRGRGRPRRGDPGLPIEARLSDLWEQVKSA